MTRSLGVLLTVIFAANAYKILVYNPKFGQSHSNYMGRIADLLTEAGHNVSSLISEIESNLKDGTALLNIIRVNISEATKEMYAGMRNSKTDYWSLNNWDLMGAYHLGQYFGKLQASQCRGVLEEPELVERLTAEKYDVFFTEHFDMCGVGLSHLIKPKSLISIAQSNPFGPQLEEFGIPTALSYDPALYVSRMNVHSMWDRIMNIYGNFLVRLMFNAMRTHTHAVYNEKFGDNFPTFDQISSHSAFVFTGTEPLLDYAVPSISKVIPIGGIGAAEAKPLSEDWEKILTKRDKTILLSFGSVAKSAYLPMDVKLSIVETVKAFPDVTFIWKYEEEDEFMKHIASKVANLDLTKWMPQVDILAHPRLSAFITHGGMGSTQEISLRGVPGIFIPIFGDQFRNAGMMEHNKLGKILDKTDVTNSEKVIAVIKEILEDDSYRKNAKRISTMLRKRPFSAKEQMLKYTEFAAEFGPSKALRPQSHDMNWIEYNNLDILFVGFIFVLLKAAILFTVVKAIFTRIFRASKGEEGVMQHYKLADQTG